VAQSVAVRDTRSRTMADCVSIRFSEILHDSWGKFPLRSACCLPQCASQEIVALAQRAGDGRQVRLRDVSRIMADARYRKSPANSTCSAPQAGSATEAMRANAGNCGARHARTRSGGCGDAVSRSSALTAMASTRWSVPARASIQLWSIYQPRSSAGRSGHVGVSPRFEGYTSAWGGRLCRCATAEQAAFLDHGIPMRTSLPSPVAGRQTSSRGRSARGRYLKRVGLGQYHTYGVGHGIGFTECLEEKNGNTKQCYDLPTGIAMMIDVGLSSSRFYGASMRMLPHFSRRQDREAYGSADEGLLTIDTRPDRPQPRYIDTGL